VAARKQMVNMRRKVENHIYGVLTAFGIKLGVVTRDRFSTQGKAVIASQEPLVKTTMLTLLKARDGLMAEEKAFDKQCTAIAKKDAVCKRLMTIPGVGVVISLAFKAEIDDPNRFKHSRDVGVHLGLTPR
jgi:transposase